MGLALLDGQVHAVEDLPVLGADVEVLDLERHTVTVSFFLRGWTRSSSVISFRVRTMDPWTRVHSSLVGQGSAPSRAQVSTPSASAVMHSIGAISPSRAATISAIVTSAAGRARLYPPCAPRRDSTSCALRSRWTRCSR